jgi:hypothetical protein
LESKIKKRINTIDSFSDRGKKIIFVSKRGEERRGESIKKAALQ